MKLGGTLLTLLGSAFGLGKYNANIVKKKELYKKDGSLIYLNVEGFEKIRLECQDNISRELVKINSKITKVNDTLERKHEEEIKVAKIMGRIEEFMNRSK